MSAEPYYFFMKALSNELTAFMMQIEDGLFTCHIMNTYRVVHEMLADFLLFASCKGKHKCQPIGNKESLKGTNRRQG
jgi:hypothetical protein